MQRLKNIYVFLDKKLKLKTYERKLIFIFFIILLLTISVFFPVFTYMQIVEELDFATKGIENAVNIRTSLFEKRLKILEKSLKNLPLEDFNSIPYIIGYSYEGKTYNMKHCDKEIDSKLHICDERSVHVRINDKLEVAVKKDYFKDVLSPSKGMISVYNPKFFIDNKTFKPPHDICFYKNLSDSNIFVFGCIDRKKIIETHILTSLNQGLLLSALFIIISYLLIRFKIKDIILFPVVYLKNKSKNLDINNIEKIEFDLHKHVNDEFGDLSKALEDMRLNIVKYNKEIELILDTTSKMVSFTNDIYRFILFTLNKIEEIFKNVKGSVVFIYDKETFKDIIEIHSDGFFKNYVISEKEIKEIALMIKKAYSEKSVITHGENYILILKKELTEDKEMLFLAISEKEFDEHEIKYMNIIILHLVYSVNLLNLANFDTLTRLYNRQALTKKIHNEIQRAKRYNEPLSILLIDIDDFKKINDTYGHFVGDFVLKSLARILKENLREIDIVGRWGGEEFLILLPNTDSDEAVFIAERIKKEVNEHVFEVNGLKIKTSLSIGVATLGVHGSNLEELLQSADISLYKAKRSGKNLVISLDKEEVKQVLNTEFSRKAILEEILEQDGVFPYFQGIHDIKTKEIIGYEVLARIKMDDEIISAGSFIGDFIKFGLIEQLDRKIQNKTVSCLSKKKIFDKLIFFNLSRSFIHNISNFEDFIQKCENLKIPLENIVFEITEEEAITDINTVREVIRIAKSKNMKFALDDFGAGYSTFSYIKYFDIDFIKIDGSLVKDVSKNKDNQIILEGIIHISNLKGIKTIAEWVENEDDLETLKKLGIDYVQGFYLSRPYNLCN